MRTPLLATSLLVALGGCVRDKSLHEFTSLRVEIVGSPRAGRVRTVDKQDPAAAELADVLSRCRQHEVVKFRSRYRVIAQRRDGTEVTFLVLHEWAKIDGIAFRCERNLDELIERLWADVGTPGVTWMSASGVAR